MYKVIGSGTLASSSSLSSNAANACDDVSIVRYLAQTGDNQTYGLPNIMLSHIKRCLFLAENVVGAPSTRERDASAAPPAIAFGLALLFTCQSRLASVSLERL